MGLTYKPREQFVPFHNRHQRWGAMNTHRRAGKTVALVNDLIVGALECPLYRPQLAYIGPTYGQAKRVAWQYLKDYSEQYWDGEPMEGELKLKLVGDRTIYCLGSDNPDAIRGMYLDGGVGDEYALFKPSVFTAIIRPALSDRNGWFVFTSTPRGKNHFHQVCKVAQQNPQEWFYLHLPADTSGIMDPKELEDLRKDMDPEEFAQEYLCSFDSALKGAIYAQEVNDVFMQGRVRKNLFDPNLKLYVAFDLGITDATIAIFWQEGPDGDIRIVKVVATTGVSIFSHIEGLHSLPAELGDVWLPHDARAKSLQTGRSLIEQFLDEDIRPQIVPNHKIRDRLAATRRMFPRVYFEDGECDDLLEALKGYKREWNKNTLSFNEQPYHDWCSDYADAFGYMAMVASKKRFAYRSPVEATKAGVLSTYGVDLDTLWAARERKTGGLWGRIQ